MDVDSENATLLVVDDDPTNRRILTLMLNKRGHNTVTAESGGEALEHARSKQPHLILLDIILPGMDGYETCHRLKADPETSDIPIIFLSSLDHAQDKVKGLDAGAVDFITKPFDPSEVIARVETHLTISRLKRTLETQNERLALELRIARDLLKESRRRFEGPLVGNSKAIRRLREDINEVSQQNAPILINGARGSGEDTVAYAIHFEAKKRRRAFITCYCTQITQQKNDSSASSSHAASSSSVHAIGILGKLELAMGGTLYLDSVQDLPMNEQRAILSFIKRLGKEGKSDLIPRIIAYSWKNLADLASNGRFVPELYRILAKNRIIIPPLVDRLDDLPQLVEHYLRVYNDKLGKSIEAMSDDSLARMKQYHWPGNIRELEAIIERAITLNDQAVIDVDDRYFETNVSLGAYKLVRRIGTGGMGEVWLGEHQLLARPAAVKLIRPESLGNKDTADIRTRFRREAKATASLESPHTVKLFDFGVDDKGTFYYVMEHLRGIDLAWMLRRFGPLPAERVIYLLRQACRSLHEAHSVGLVHRDVKPGNLFVCKLGLEFDFLKVLDFGVVKGVLGESDVQVTNVREGVPGTPATMAPETAVGSTDTDLRVDIYALGCVAMHLLTGKNPFIAEDSTATLMRHVTFTPPKPSKILNMNLPAGLDEIVMDCLRKAREKRPSSAAELERRLADVVVENPWTRERAENWWWENLAHICKAVTIDSDALNDPQMLLTVDDKDETRESVSDFFQPTNAEPTFSQLILDDDDEDATKPSYHAP